MDQPKFYRFYRMETERVLHLARKMRLHVAIGNLNFRCHYYFTSFTIVFSMSCLMYVASGKALFSIFAEIPVIRIFVMVKVQQHDAGFSSCSQPLPSHSSVLYVQSNRKIVAK